MALKNRPNFVVLLNRFALIKTDSTKVDTTALDKTDIVETTALMKTDMTL